VQQTGSSQGLFKEKYRPQFHFTPAKNWINDPNGLIYYGGEYHMFFQYNPQGNVWGHMSWGHAVSKDLIHWQELPVALNEENDIAIFSGSAVADAFNTTGFKKQGTVPLVAIYTGNIENKNQSQHIAYSLDSGRTFTKFEGNPVIDLDRKDFRDPKVFWYEPSKRWVMATVLADEKKIQLYGSKSLKAWNLLSEFGPAGDTTGIWECPDLFRVPVVGSAGKYKWVLMHSPSPYMQYFVGEFDGIKFTNENKKDKIYRPDYGPDYYAAIVYNNMPVGDAPIGIGWVNNWNYANQIPAGDWRGAMSIPRTIAVKRVENEWFLVQQPVEQLNSIRGPVQKQVSSQPISLGSQSFDLEWSWKDDGVGVSEAVFGNFEFVIRFNKEKREVEINRSGGSKNFQNKAFHDLGIFKAKFPVPSNGLLKFRLLFDQSIAELFVGEGELVMTAQVFPDMPLQQVQFGYSTTNPTPSASPSRLPNEAIEVTLRAMAGYR
jgi:fructan beta-fructosidase